MMIKGYQHKILKMYEKIREDETHNLKNRKEEVYSKFPEIEELEKEINKLCVKLSISAFKPIKNREEFLHDLREKITDLRMKKTELLVSND